MRVRGFHWVSWDEISCPKESGGLETRSLRIMNEALLTKWLWRFAIKDDALWRKLIVSKYGVDSFGWWNKRSSFAHEAGCWKAILSRLDIFKSLVRFEVRNGVKVFFWHDTWCGDQPLKVHFLIFLGWLV